MSEHYKTYYLNNRGDRWVNTDCHGRHDQITLQTKSGRTITRKVAYWEQFGNFATANVSYKGKRINVFTDTVLED